MKATHLALVAFNDSTHSAVFNIAIKDGNIFLWSAITDEFIPFKMQSNYLTVSIVKSGDKDD